jgi:membrane protein implicated in regulation of membrane protease activity
MNIDVFLGQISKAGTVLLIFLAASFSILLPLWFRIFFIRKVQGQSNVSVEQFIQFEKTFILIAELSLYVALIAYLFKAPKMQMLFIALFGFYAAYYYFPSLKRIHHEKKLFRVKE